MTGRVGAGEGGEPAPGEFKAVALRLVTKVDHMGLPGGFHVHVIAKREALWAIQACRIWIAAPLCGARNDRYQMSEFDHWSTLQPCSLFAVSATRRPWKRAPSSSTWLGWRLPSPAAIVVAP